MTFLQELVAGGHALARWTFFNPVILPTLTDFVKQLQAQPSRSKERQPQDPPPSSSGKGGFHEHVTLSRGRMVEFVEHLAKLGLATDKKGVSMVLDVYQHHGDVVYVPPGHMHQVENLQNCTKVAFDRYKVEELSQYAMSWMHVAPHLDMVPDYMAANRVVLQAICQRCHS